MEIEKAIKAKGNKESDKDWVRLGNSKWHITVWLEKYYGETESTQWMALRVCLIWSSVKSGSPRTMFKEYQSGNCV